MAFGIIELMVTKISDEKLKMLIKESVREVLSNELMKLRALALSDVSKKEQADIEKRYDKPSKKKAKTYTVKVEV